MTQDVRVLKSLDEIKNLSFRNEDILACNVLGLSEVPMIRACFEMSRENFIVSFDGNPVCIWGHRPEDRKTSIWMFTTKEVDNYKLAFAKESRRLVRAILTEFDSIEALVHCSHEVSIKWLYWLGFKEKLKLRHGNEFFFVVQKDKV